MVRPDESHAVVRKVIWQSYDYYLDTDWFCRSYEREAAGYNRHR